MPLIQLLTTILLLLTATPGYAGKHTWQWPDTQTPDASVIILNNTGYKTAYSKCKRSPLWVSYPLAKKKHQKWPRKKPYFKPDPRTASHVSPDDYWLSGYDRGHLAPGYAVWAVSGPAARKQTYLMSNIVPQKKRLNQKLWQRLEEVAITHFPRHLDNISVYTGPVFSHPERHTDSGLPIPQAYFKIFSAYRQKQLVALAFLMPQNVTGTESLDDYLVSIDKIEQMTNLDFFHWLHPVEQDQLESVILPAAWNMAALSDLPGRY